MMKDRGAQKCEIGIVDEYKQISRGDAMSMSGMVFYSDTKNGERSRDRRVNVGCDGGAECDSWEKQSMNDRH